MDDSVINEDSNLSIAGSPAPSDFTGGESGESVRGERLTVDEDVDDTLLKEDSEEPILDETSSSAAPIASRRETYNRNAYIMLDVNHKKVEASDVIEYEWPMKSGDRWFLQEQIGELLDIKSFSRKFPDLSRRKVNHEEREFLESKFAIHKLLNETQLRDMNAMRSAEIHDLMNAEYPDVYQEYKRFVTQREREIALEKAKEMEAIKNDSVKLAELRKKALASAADFNKDLQKARMNDRKHFWDIQTNIVQSRLSKWKKMPSEATKPHPYPVALIPGQYQQYFKKFTKEETMRLPVGTVLETGYLYPPVRRAASPPPLSIAEQDLERLERAEAVAKARAEAAAVSTPTATVLDLDDKEVKPKPIEEPQQRKCESCDGSEPGLLTCTICQISYHPKCIEMPERMAAIVRTYQWSCVDCRLCSICNKPDKEDEIIFCDRCDRGFHTYCVGLNKAPDGTWYCNAFCGTDDKKKGRPPVKRPSIHAI